LCQGGTVRTELFIAAAREARARDAGFLVQRSALREDRGLVHAEIESDPEKMRIIEMDRGLRDAP